MTKGEATLRVDSWLFRARFYKSRSLAATAVSGGHVHLNGSRVKTSRGVSPGDILAIRHARGRYRIRITGIPTRRGPAGEAEEHYEIVEFEPAAVRRDGRADGAAAPRKRPDKRGRRRLRELKGRR